MIYRMKTKQQMKSEEQLLEKAMSHQLTVAAVSSVCIREHKKAIDVTASSIPFPVRKLFVEPSKPLNNVQDYSRFIIKDLPSLIETPYVLIVQADGYAVNPEKWSDSFLEWDYIGAPWPQWCSKSWKSMVGNGGFSLRSKKWLDAAKELSEIHNGEAEDYFCCKTHVKHFLNRGCKIAPVDVAIRFSFENKIISHPFWKARDSFGIHHPKRRLTRIVQNFLYGPRDYTVE